MILLVFGSLGADVQKITPWLLGVNFTITIFSINFTFFGYQLSKYKAIYSDISNRQWFNIIALLCLPFFPLICFLITPEYFGRVALWTLPILMFSSIDNALLTSRYLSPKKFIKLSTVDRAISRYLSLLVKEIEQEFEEHQRYLTSREKYQIPTHAYKFEPRTLGLELNDVWDSVAVITKLSIENNDYTVFRESLNSILKLVLSFYLFKCQGEHGYRVEGGIKFIARNRLRSVISTIVECDDSGMFIQSLSSELCDFLMRDELLSKPCSDVARAIASDCVWVGKKMLDSHGLIEPIKILNSIHRTVEINIYNIASDNSDETSKSLDGYNISVYAYDIKELGVAALNSGNSHFAYRCMETLSYLGCNAAKLKSTQVVVAVFESIVHLGRVARNSKIGCFWSRCLIPAESHAEEFMGHMLTWLVQDIKPNGEFFMKDYAEQAYSRIRGVKCAIQPRKNSSPCFWIDELVKDGEKIPHVEYESGMFGYSGESNYADFTNLKEYVLHGIGSGSASVMVHGAPIPLDLDPEDNGGDLV